MATRTVLLLLGAATLLTACGGSSSPGAEPEAGDPGTSGPAGSGALSPTPDLGSAERPDGVDEIGVGTGPVGLTVDESGAVWVVGAQSETVSRVPPGADEPDLELEVTGVPLRVHAAYDALWVTSFGGEAVVRIDLASGEELSRTPTGAGPEGLTAAFGSMWVVAQDAGRLLRLDPADGEISERIEIGVGARLVTAGKRWLYVSHYRDGQVLRIDPESGEVARSPGTCGGPQGMALAGGRLWVACSVDGTVLGLDPDSLEVVSTVKAADAPDAVTVAPDGRVLVASQAGPTLLVIDPADPAGAEQVPLGEEDQLYDQANIDVVVTDGQVFVSSFASDVLLRAALP